MFTFRTLSCTGAILKNLFERCFPAETMTFRDMGHLGKLFMGIFLSLLKGIWDTCLFTSKDMGNW